MNKRYSFMQNEIEAIISHFGEDFYEKIVRDVEIYADKWALTSFQFIPSYSAKIVFKCFSEKFGNAALKIGNPASREIRTEFHTLRQYNGRRFCKVLDVDIENGVILEECIQPGIPLRKEGSLDQRLEVFCSLYKGLHLPLADREIYPTYIEWVGRITEYMSKRQDCKELYLLMKKANDICLSISASYPQKMLLHGDFHHDNILLGNGGKYVIIDPKGVVGDPVFDVPRFVLNEFGDELTAEVAEKIHYITGFLEQNLSIPNDILKKCLFVETAMGECWMVEDGSTPEQNSRLLEIVSFAEAIMNH